MANYEKKLNEIVEGAKEISDEKFPVYLDLLVQRGLLIKKGEAYTATDAFRLVLYKYFIKTLEDFLKLPKIRQKLLAEDSPAEDLLLNVSLRVALEIITGKALPVDENDLEYVSRKEVGALARTIYSYLVACKKDELKEMSEDLKELLKEAEK